MKKILIVFAIFAITTFAVFASEATTKSIKLKDTVDALEDTSIYVEYKVGSTAAAPKAGTEVASSKEETGVDVTAAGSISLTISNEKKTNFAAAESKTKGQILPSKAIEVSVTTDGWFLTTSAKDSTVDASQKNAITVASAEVPTATGNLASKNDNTGNGIINFPVGIQEANKSYFTVLLSWSAHDTLEAGDYEAVINITYTTK
ncbi:MAG: hypothetical protein HUK24_03155 [Sphaerochaetaceae bacterium]|nr:hypothetical protein [Sphaerochaetaceae bacterium]